MTGNIIYNSVLISWFILSIFIFIALLFIVAPYGRHHRSGWWLSLNSTLGWVIMESASPLVFALCFIFGKNPLSITSLVFLFLWEAHYIHRAFIYPFSLKSSDGNMPLSVVLSGMSFNMINASLNGYYIFTLSGTYTDQWLTDPRFIVGICVFIAGFFINRQSDYILSKLRRPGESQYKIPYGGLYKWVSCPNYLGEILIWSGWALATWSLAGLSFAIWTAANLIPRARAHHAWYHARFPSYPEERKTLIPGVW